MAATQSALAYLLLGMADAWAPRERISLSDWCAREIHLPAETGPTPGLIDLDRFPYMREPIDAADDPEVERIVFCTATQIGKTTFLQCILAALSVLRPAPAMLCAPDQDATKKVRDKFYRLCDASPALRERVPVHHLRNMSEIDFGRSLCHLAWTGNPQRVAGESCRVVLVTECDRSHRATHEGAVHKLIGERVKAWHNFLIVLEGTPTDENSVIVGEYEKSDQRRYLVLCPRCGHYQPLRFFVHREGEYKGCGGVAGLKTDDGKWLMPDEVEQAAYYLCEKGCRIEPREKDEMVQRGKWCPKGCEVNAEGEITGTPDRSRRHTGFGEIGSLYSPTISIGRMAREYLDSRDDEKEFQSFINNWCGLRYTPRTKTPRAFELFQRLRGSHPRGTVPPGALFLTAGVDVHDENTHWIVRAWGEGCTSWLVDWGVCPVQTDDQGHAKMGSQLSPIQAMVLERDWKLVTENALGHETLRVVKLGVDCGWVPLAVHNFARQFSSDLVLTVAGDTQPVAGQPWTFSVVDRNQRSGKPYPGGLKRWAINTDAFKVDLHDRFTAPLDEPGAWWLTDAPYDAARTHLEQVANEGRVMTANQKGFPVARWVILRSGLGNHFLDCEVYSRALADMVTGGVWGNLTERLRASVRHQQQQQAKPIGDGEPDSERTGFVRRPSVGFGKRRG